jgi:hypothetical protein
MGAKGGPEWRSLRRVGIVYDKVLEIVKTDLVYDEVHGIVDGVPSLLSRKLCRELLRNGSISATLFG